MQILLIVLVLIGVYFWAKYSFFRVDLSRNVDVFPSRGVPLVKRSKIHATEKKPQRQLKAEQQPLKETINSPALSESVQKSVLTENDEDLTPQVPEDAMLRRHFTSQLKAEIEVKLGSKPTDFSLARHYDGMLQAEIAKALARDLR